MDADHTPRPVLIDSEYIELDKLLKREDLAASGGEARFLISQGLVRVDGLVELRKRRKLYHGSVVEIGEARLKVWCSLSPARPLVP